MGDFLSALEPEASSKSPRGKQEDETAKAPSTGAISRNMFVWGGDVELLATAGIVMPIADKIKETSEEDSSTVPHVTPKTKTAKKAGRRLTASGQPCCSHPDCTRKAQYKGLCKTHGGFKLCSHPECKKRALSRGKCFTHGGGTTCLFSGCHQQARSKGLCALHSGR
ncbi:hypothetical protein GQ600_20259 [Phytophthora cactorum]|nr:hypothetical protein GQ600_20259 [Phytophthora cactorum]